MWSDELNAKSRRESANDPLRAPFVVVQASRPEQIIPPHDERNRSQRVCHVRYRARRQFRTQTLIEVIMEVGADRILYSVDYPFENTGIAADWFDHCGISDSDRAKTGRTKPERLFRP
jgi:hypothetical protein